MSGASDERMKREYTEPFGQRAAQPLRWSAGCVMRKGAVREGEKVYLTRLAGDALVAFNLESVNGRRRRRRVSERASEWRESREGPMIAPPTLGAGYLASVSLHLYFTGVVSVALWGVGIAARDPAAVLG